MSNSFAALFREVAGNMASVADSAYPASVSRAADLVTEMEQLKHPFRSGVRAQKGIEF